MTLMTPNIVIWVRGLATTETDIRYWIAKGWERYRPMVYLAADSGMRPQEYLALRDIDVQEKGVRIGQALKADNKIGPPKSAAGRRYIPIGTLKPYR